MNCPNCSSVLSVVKDEYVDYFKCGSCGGTLAKGKALADLLYRLEKSVEVRSVKRLENIKVENIYTLKEAPFNCPGCSSRMEKFNYAYDSNIFADRCPKCQYVWLNNGELEKIAAHIAPNPYYKKVGIMLADILNYGKKKEVVEERTSLPLFSISSVVLGDGSIPFKFPFMTILLIALNAVLMWLMIGSYQILDESLGTSFFNLGNLSPDPSLPIKVGDWFIIHLFFNSLMLWIFGDNLEDSFGHIGFLLFYTLMWFVLGFFMPTGTDIVVVMSIYSAVISALMGAYFVLYPDAKLKIYSFFSDTTYKVPAKGSLLLFISQQVFSFFINGKNFRNGYLFQIAGFILGCFIAFLLKKFRMVRIIKNFSEFE